jgi:hypothetical protein
MHRRSSCAMVIARGPYSTTSRSRGSRHGNPRHYHACLAVSTGVAPFEKTVSAETPSRISWDESGGPEAADSECRVNEDTPHDA